MIDYEQLAEALRGHKSDYDEGRTQSLCNIIADCERAATAIDRLAEYVKHYAQRLNHLLKSEIIRECDMYEADGKTHVRNVEELDAQMHMLEQFLADQETAVSEPCVLYLCDRRKCTMCRKDCAHTDDVRHAKNFELSDQHAFMMIEKEG